jgi:hypothetical protein
MTWNKKTPYNATVVKNSPQYCSGMIGITDTEESVCLVKGTGQNHD